MVDSHTQADHKLHLYISYSATYKNVYTLRTPIVINVNYYTSSPVIIYCRGLNLKRAQEVRKNTFNSPPTAIESRPRFTSCDYMHLSWWYNSMSLLSLSVYGGLQRSLCKINQVLCRVSFVPRDHRRWRTADQERQWSGKD